jgi:hypothetical protein
MGKQKRAYTKRRYTEEQKLAAVTAMRTMHPEHSLGAAAIAAARAVLGAPVAVATLGRWMLEYRPQIDAVIVPLSNEQTIIATRDNVLGQMAEVRQKSLKRLADDSVINAAAARDLAVVTGIMSDHIAKATALPAATSERALRLREVCQRVGVDVDALLDDMIRVAENTQIEPRIITSAATLSAAPSSTQPIE